MNVRQRRLPARVVLAVRAALPSPRPQGWQALQFAAGLAEHVPTTLIGDAGRPDGGPATLERWLGRPLPAALTPVVPSRPSRPPLAGVLFRRALARAASPDAVLVCRDPRVAAAQPRRRWSHVVMEWHVRPEPGYGALTRPDLHVTVARGLADDLRACGVPDDRILLLANACGLDPERARRRSPSADGPVIAMGLHRRGGLDLALDAWAADASLPPLHIVGRDQGGARADAWSAAVARRGLPGRVQLLGPAWGPAREALLDGAATWLAAYPDDADTRTRLCPLQVADALGSGLPLVAPDLPSIQDLAGTAPWSPYRPDDPADLARAVHAARGAPAPSAPRPTWADRAATLLGALAARMEVSP